MDVVSAFDACLHSVWLLPVLAVMIAADGPAREILRDKALLERCELELPLRWQRDF